MTLCVQLPSFIIYQHNPDQHWHISSSQMVVSKNLDASVRQVHEIGYRKNIESTDSFLWGGIIASILFVTVQIKKCQQRWREEKDPLLESKQGQSEIVRSYQAVIEHQNIFYWQREVSSVEVCMNRRRAGLLFLSDGWKLCNCRILKPAWRWLLCTLKVFFCGLFYGCHFLFKIQTAAHLWGKLNVFFNVLFCLEMWHKIILLWFHKSWGNLFKCRFWFKYWSKSKWYLL